MINVYHPIGGQLLQRSSLPTAPIAPVATTSVGPVPVANVNQLQSLGYATIPTDANFVMWNSPAGTDLWDVFNALGANDILVLPESPTPYVVTQFRTAIQGAPVGASVKRGIIGLGPGAVVAMSSSFPTSGQQTSGSVDDTMLDCWSNNAYFANFTIKGKNIGGRAFCGLTVRQATGVRVERVRTVGHYGFAYGPPGEAFGLSFWRCTSGLTINKCEVDGRDPVTGVVQGSGGIHLQRGGTTTVNDCYVHHVRGNGIANWTREGATTINNLTLDSIGVASNPGRGINLEACGTYPYSINNSTFRMKRATTGNRDAFVADVAVPTSPGTSGAAYSTGRTPVTFTNCTFDEISPLMFVGTGSSAAAYDGLANASLASDFSFSPAQVATYTNFNPSAITRPTGTQYVTYESLQTGGLSLRQVLAAAPAGKIVTFPEGTFEFQNFNDPTGYYEGIRVPSKIGGIIGSGLGTIFRMTANSSTVGSDTTAVPPSNGSVQAHLMATWTSGHLLKNFQLQGTDQGHIYSGLRVAGNSAGSPITGVVIDGVFFNGANPGTANVPPGETAAMSTNYANNTSLLNCEFDGRHPTTRVRNCASPFGWNNSSNAYVSDVYAHHSKAGMPTFYACSGVHTVRLRSEFNGSGSGQLSGEGINHENVTGTVLHEFPTIVIDRANGNTGLHISMFNGIADQTDFTVTEPTFDAGPSNGAFAVSMYSVYVDPQGRAQKQISPPTVVKNGLTLVPRNSKTYNLNSVNAATDLVDYY